MSDTEKSRDKGISFGPNFMSDDIPIFSKAEQEDDPEWKRKLFEESVKVEDKVKADKETKKANKTDQGLVRLISILASQAYIFLGAMENPSTGTRTPHLEQARESIDCLSALAEKTAGNLSEEEEKLLKQVVSELQMIYVESTRSPTGPLGGPGSIPPAPQG